MKFSMMRVVELDVLQSLILRHKTVPDDLHFWLMRDGLQIWVQNASLGIKGFAVSISLCLGIESLGKLILSSRGATRLALEDDYLGLV